MSILIVMNNLIILSNLIALSILIVLNNLIILSNLIILNIQISQTLSYIESPLEVLEGLSGLWGTAKGADAFCD